MTKQQRPLATAQTTIPQATRRDRTRQGRSQRWLPALLLAGLACGAQAECVRSAAMLSHTCAGCHGADGASAGEIVSAPGAGGLSDPQADVRTRAIEVQFALGWYRNITADMFT